MADVSYQRPEYEEALPEWEAVDTLCDGEAAVKRAGEKLLPNPVVASGETRQELEAIYSRYKQRAMYMNVVGRTRQSLIGMAYMTPPSLTVPANLAYMAEDADGKGLSIYQQSQKSLEDVLTTGRAGLLVDFPKVEGAVSVADMQSGIIRANICHYDAQDIINWQHTRVGGKSVLSLVVLSEKASEAGDFANEEVRQLRELRLDGVYQVRLWRKNKVTGFWEVVDESIPLDASGNPWSAIPFTFIGAVNNDSSIDMAPLFDLAAVNRKHYQLGADWYNALYYAGQPQPVITGLDADWRDWLEKNGIVVGSRAPFLLPAGGNFTYATVTADSAIQKELADLEQRMIALGARLITPGEAVKTATQASGEQAVSHSVVSLSASNVSEAYTLALKWAQSFMGGAGGCAFTLSTDYVVPSLDPAMVSALVASWQSGTVPKQDVQEYFKRAGLIKAERTQEEIDELTNTAGIEL